MDRQLRYDVMLVAIPVLLAVGGLATALTSGLAAVIAAFGSVLAAAGTIGRALFLSPPTDATS